MAPAAQRAPADLLGFAAPGLLHGLGNHLFTVHGHAQLLRDGGDELARQKLAIVKASEKAVRTLAILRYIAGEVGPEPPPQAGVLLLRLFDTLKVSLRESGLRVEFSHRSSNAPVSVDGEVLCQSVVAVLRALATDVPRGLQRALAVDLASQGAGGVEIEFRVAIEPSFLPFPVDLDHVAAQAGPVLRRHGAQIEGAERGQQLRLTLPVRQPETAGERCQPAAESQQTQR